MLWLRFFGCLDCGRKLKANRNRLVELKKLLQSAFEEKVLGKLPENVCISLCEKYRAEKEVVENKTGELEKKIAEINKLDEDVGAYIGRLKYYSKVKNCSVKCVCKLWNLYRWTKKTQIIYYKFISHEKLNDF